MEPAKEERHLRDRMGIAKLVDPTGRRPAEEEEKRLRAQAAAGKLDVAGKLRLGFLLARKGLAGEALRWYREATIRP